LRTDELDRWGAEFLDHGNGWRELVKADGGNLGDILKETEKRIQRTYKKDLKLLRLDEKWRSRTPSVGQLSAASRIGMKVPKSANRGEVSVALGRVFGQKTKASAG